MQDADDFSRLLTSASEGDRRALDRLVPLVYDELRALAARHMAHERADHTLSPTALVNEAYLRLARHRQHGWSGRAHFLAIAARAMRRVLLDHAAGRRAQKRGGGRPHVPLDAVQVPTDDQALDTLLQLDAALDRLKDLDERQARVVECRFFAGMSVEETAEALGIAPATVKRDWTAARAWLNREME